MKNDRENSNEIGSHLLVLEELQDDVAQILHANQPISQRPKHHAYQISLTSRLTSSSSLSLVTSLAAGLLRPALTLELSTELSKLRRLSRICVEGSVDMTGLITPDLAGLAPALDVDQ